MVTNDFKKVFLVTALILMGQALAERCTDCARQDQALAVENLDGINEELRRNRGCCNDVLNNLSEVEDQLDTINHTDRKILHKVKDIEHKVKDIDHDTDTIESVVELIQMEVASQAETIGTEDQTVLPSLIDCASVNDTQLSVIQWLKAIYIVLSCNL